MSKKKYKEYLTAQRQAQKKRNDKTRERLCRLGCEICKGCSIHLGGSHMYKEYQDSGLCIDCFNNLKIRLKKLKKNKKMKA